MNRRPNDIGSSSSWLDTVPMGATDAPVAGASRLDVRASAAKGVPTLRDALQPPRHSPRPTAKESPRELARAETSVHSRSLRRKPVSLWHRPLAEVLGLATRQLASQLARARSAATIDRSRSLTVVPRRPAPQVRRGDPDSIGERVAAFTENVTDALKSMGLVCVRWIRPEPPPPVRAVQRAVPPPPPPPPRAAFAPAFVPPSSNAMSHKPTPAPRSESVPSFKQELYGDAGKTLSYDPNGMGTLWVQTSAGTRHIAGPEAKWYFLAVLKRFEELGEAMNVKNQRYVAMTRSFADALLAHPTTDAIWQDIVADDPRHVARCFAGLDKPRNLVVEVPPDAIQRIDANASIREQAIRVQSVVPSNSAAAQRSACV